MDGFKGFLLSCGNLFDVFCDDSERRKNLEKYHDVRMTECEWKFLTDQRTDRKMYCEGYVDKKWAKKWKEEIKNYIH